MLNGPCLPSCFYFEPIPLYYMIRIINLVTVKLLLIDSALVIMNVNGSLLLTIMGRAPPLGNKLPVMLVVD